MILRLSAGMRQAVIIALAVVSIAAVRTIPDSEQSYLIIVNGLGGDPSYGERFHEWSAAMAGVARQRFDLAADHIWYFAEQPKRDPENIRDKSTRENITQAFLELKGKVGPSDQLFVMLIGHGSYREGESRFNLPGPDLTATDFARLLAPFSANRVVFINTASASGEFIGALSQKGWVVLTATKTGLEKNETLFGKYFVEAFSGTGADLDKNGRVSILEAYNYAVRRVARAYDDDNRLLTEHALLDDNGDGVGVHEPGFQTGNSLSAAEGSTMDGHLAGSSFLNVSSRAAGVASSPENPELEPLYDEIRALEARISELKQQKDTMAPALYFEELERLLLDLARKKRRLAESRESRES